MNSSPAPAPAVSAVIRARNSGRTLRACLESLQRQTLPPAEIILVDSGSTDDTLDIAASFSCRILRYPPDQDFNYSKALNLGFAAATSPYVLSLSSHCEFLRPDSVAAMLRQIEFFDASSAYCNHISPAGHEETGPPCLVETIYTDNFDGFNGLQNPASLIRRDLWEKRPFNETLPTAEDNEWVSWHYRESRLCSVALRNHPVAYRNPYRTHRKIIRETLTVANYIHPPTRSFRAIAWFLIKGVQEYTGRRFSEGWMYHLIAFALLVNRVIPLRPRTSVYSPRLKKP